MIRAQAHGRCAVSPSRAVVNLLNLSRDPENWGRGYFSSTSSSTGSGVLSANLLQNTYLALVPGKTNSVIVPEEIELRDRVAASAICFSVWMSLAGARKTRTAIILPDMLCW